MKKLVLPLVVIGAIASGTAPEPVSEPCVVPDSVDFVVTTDGLSTVISTPENVSPYPLGLGIEPDPLGMQEAATDRYEILVDVNPYRLSATPTFTLQWEHFGDVDMDLYVDGELRNGSHIFNPMDADNVESADAGVVGHCQVVELTVRNYISGPGYISLDVTLDSAEG